MLESRCPFPSYNKFVFAFGAITIVLVYRLFCICNTMIHETEKKVGNDFMDCSPIRNQCIKCGFF